MWQLSECIDGMTEACRALSLPVIGGNVSLYNESGGSDIDPTPVLGVLGLVDAVRTQPPGLAWSEGDAVVLLGARAGDGRFVPARGDALGHRAARPPHRRGAGRRLRGARGAVRLRRRARRAHRWAGEDSDVVRAVHDVSGGGLAVALAEMAAAAGTGCVLEASDPAELFTELPSRFVVATPAPDELCARADAAGIPAAVLGRAGGDRFSLGGLVDLPVDALADGGRAEPGPGPGRRMTSPCARMGERVKEACGVFGVYAPGIEGGQPHVRRPLRPAAPRPGVGRHGGERRRHRHRRQGHGPRGDRLRRAHPLGPRRAPRHRAHPLLDARVLGLGRGPAGLPAGGAGRLRARSQRQPDQHRRPGREGRDAAGIDLHRQRRRRRAADARVPRDRGPLHGAAAGAPHPGGRVLLRRS